jgi:hypothetical protein
MSKKCDKTEGVPDHSALPALELRQAETLRRPTKRKTHHISQRRSGFPTFAAGSKVFRILVLVCKTLQTVMVLIAASGDLAIVRFRTEIVPSF